MDFLLPTLRLDPTYTEASVTDVKWHDALCQKLTFVPWDEFDEIIADTREKLNGVHHEFLRGAEIILQGNNGGTPGKHLDSKEGSNGPNGTQKCTGDDVLTLRYFVQLFSDSTSTDGLHDSVFRATCLLLRGLEESPSLQMVQRGYPSQLGMEFDAEGQHLPHHVTLKPDRVLVAQTGSRLERLPVSTFEWKGPGLDFTNMGGKYGSASPTQMRLLLEEALRQSLPDRSVSEESDSDPSGAIANSSRTRARPSVDIEERENGITSKVTELIESGSRFESGISASIMCAQLNFIFRGQRKSSKPEGKRKKGKGEQGQGEQGPPRKGPTMKFARLSRLAVAQAVSQGLSSQSGCFFISTYVMGVAFEIRGFEHGKVIVAVSRPFHCNMKPGLVYSALALAYYSLQRLEDGNGIATLVRKCAHVISTSSYDIFHKGKVPQSSPSPNYDRPNTDADAPSCSKRRKSNTQSQCLETEELSVHDDEIDKRLFIQPNVGRKIGSPVTSCSHEESAACEGNEYIQERMKMMFVKCGRLLAMGGTGVVLEGTWNGFKVAIKTWNGEKPEGQLAMSSEVDMYLHIQENMPSILGVAVPRLFLGFNARRTCEGSIYNNEAILVTELVGHRVWRDADEGLFVEEQPDILRLSLEEELDLSEAALGSLQSLHDHGIIHGDVALRNLRVDRYPSRSLGPKWKAWWIDLGNAQDVGQNPFAFMFERADCLDLFASE